MNKSYQQLKKKYKHWGVLSELGRKEFTIGIWLGRGTTPNTRKDAVYALKQLNKGDENFFILDRCPWCGAQIGPVKYEKGTPKNVPRVLGYERQGDTVVFKCSDKNCEFSAGLPVYVNIVLRVKKY